MRSLIQELEEKDEKIQNLEDKLEECYWEIEESSKLNENLGNLIGEKDNEIN